MKRYMLAAFLTATSVSCKESFIDLQPISDMNAGNFYKTEQDMNQAVMSPYSSLRDLYNQLYIYRSEERR